MWNAGLDEAQAGIKISGRNINNLRYADDTTVMAESEEELKSLLMKVKEQREKAGLQLNIQNTKIMAYSPIISWQIHGETMETVTDFIFFGSKITADGDCSHEIKRHFLLGRKDMTNLGRILKSRDITLLTKVSIDKAMVFPIATYGCELDLKESWASKNWCFLFFLLFFFLLYNIVLVLPYISILLLEKTLESPLDSKEINQSILKEISPKYSLEGLMLRLKLQYFGHLMGRDESLEMTLMLGNIEGRRRRGWQRVR